MTRLYLFAEGRTEETFADTVLKPHLAKLEVFLHPAMLISHARKRGRAHRGGGRNYAPMKNDIQRLLAQQKAADVFFTTMVDLYAISSSFPRLKEAEKLRDVPVKRVEFLETAFAEDVGDRRFVPYIQLHEFEAYLFSDPGQLASFYDHHNKAIQQLQEIANRHESPEMIDDGPNSAPSKRIIAEIPDYESDKSVAGPQVAELIGLPAIRAKCPHFHGWLTRLEKLGP